MMKTRKEILSTTCRTAPMVIDLWPYIGIINVSINLLLKVEALLLDENMVLTIEIAGSLTETSGFRMSTSSSSMTVAPQATFQVSFLDVSASRLLGTNVLEAKPIIPSKA